MFRLARADPAFLLEMLYEAVNWRDDGARSGRRSSRCSTIRTTPAYIEGWGRPGDIAVIALDRSDEPVGAAWVRRFPATAPGYGYLSEAIPELAIGVFPSSADNGSAASSSAR